MEGRGGVDGVGGEVVEGVGVDLFVTGVGEVEGGEDGEEVGEEGEGEGGRGPGGEGRGGEVGVGGVEGRGGEG